MSRLFRWSQLIACLPLTACAQLPTTTEQPAVLTDSSAGSRAELARVVAQALNQPSVLLADDALLHASSLIVERRPRRDASGAPVNGRETTPPERFRLVKLGADCLLIHERTQRRVPLRQSCGVATRQLR